MKNLQVCAVDFTAPADFTTLTLIQYRYSHLHNNNFYIMLLYCVTCVFVHWCYTELSDYTVKEYLRFESCLSFHPRTIFCIFYKNCFNHDSIKTQKLLFSIQLYLSDIAINFKPPQKSFANFRFQFALILHFLLQ